MCIVGKAGKDGAWFVPLVPLCSGLYALANTWIQVKAAHPQAHSEYIVLMLKDEKEEFVVLAGNAVRELSDRVRMM